MTDPIADFLTRIRNGIIARKTEIDVPFSKIKRRMADILKEEGYLAGVSDREDPKHPSGLITIALKWSSEQAQVGQELNALEGLKRISKPGQRVYVSADDIPSVRKGMGTALISTSRGVLTDREARKLNVGGEVLCEVW